eukprot:NODE_331_length_2951_cov_45.166195_g284_i0.p1 GENE.NODE_331_length_2951_cov_45.166195_g284_i0~~NODE_331_length_2951_cov_45.166195_g284_i0.p1  ORF type:complete len:554 (+),score=102.90 NODE_331_length_2951_cov_45.166195_g284_i0:1214-2875(+)
MLITGDEVGHVGFWSLSTAFSVAKLKAVGKEKGKVEKYPIPKPVEGIKCHRMFKAHRDGIATLQFIEPQYLLTSAWDNRVFIWKITSNVNCVGVLRQRPAADSPIRNPLINDMNKVEDSEWNFVHSVDLLRKRQEYLQLLRQNKSESPLFKYNASSPRSPRMQKFVHKISVQINIAKVFREAYEDSRVSSPTSPETASTILTKQATVYGFDPSSQTLSRAETDFVSFDRQFTIINHSRPHSSSLHNPFVRMNRGSVRNNVLSTPTMNRSRWWAPAADILHEKDHSLDEIEDNHHDKEKGIAAELNEATFIKPITLLDAIMTKTRFKTTDINNILNPETPVIDRKLAEVTNNEKKYNQSNPSPISSPRNKINNVANKAQKAISLAETLRDANQKLMNMATTYNSTSSVYIPAVPYSPSTPPTSNKTFTLHPPRTPTPTQTTSPVSIRGWGLRSPSPTISTQHKSTILNIDTEDNIIHQANKVVNKKMKKPVLGLPFHKNKDKTRLDSQTGIPPLVIGKTDNIASWNNTLQHYMQIPSQNTMDDNNVISEWIDQT